MQIKYLTKLVLLISIIFYHGNLLSQLEILSLDKAIDAALNKQSLNKQKSLLTKETDLQLQLLSKQKLPLISWNAQTTLQSENINLEFPIPDIQSISLPLYKGYTGIDAGYTLYDGGIIVKLEKNEKLKEKLNLSKLDIQLSKIKTRIVDVYYSILTLEKQKEILDSSLSILNIKAKAVNAAIENGIALISDLDKIELEKIKLQKNISNIQNNIKTLRLLLSDLTGIDMKNQVLQDKTVTNYKKDWDSVPEKQFFSDNINLLENGKKLIEARKKPKIFLFAKAGIGYPNPFNIFSEKIAPYAIGGISFVWNFWDWNKSSIEKQKLEIKKSIVDINNEIFDENMRIKTNNIISKIEGLKNNLSYNDQIIKKQNQLVKTIENQYKNGVATINDFIIELTKKRISELSAAIQKIEINKLKYKLKVICNY